MNKIPVIAFKNKSKDERYLAASMDVGDWSDEELDVSINEIENAMMIWREDLSKPDEQDVDNLITLSEAHKKFLKDKFGDDAYVSFDVKAWLEIYEPINLDITSEQFEHAFDLASEE
ncbi:hypothetical protein [Sediminibacillus massiliensis]|uniref:hypothetical protein n=1 Tax=Sediminibacillus massiliensis TaxID=1926277 RepID=UPI000988898A|nr:hypothetical protein [Sediminibacillus massiliensis]